MSRTDCRQHKERIERHKTAKWPRARAKIGNECLPRVSILLWTYTAFDPMERMSMTAGMMFGCPTVACLRCLILRLTTVGAGDCIVPSESRVTSATVQLPGSCFRTGMNCTSCGLCQPCPFELLPYIKTHFEESSEM